MNPLFFFKKREKTDVSHEVLNYIFIAMASFAELQASSKSAAMIHADYLSYQADRMINM